MKKGRNFQKNGSETVEKTGTCDPLWKNKYGDNQYFVIFF